MSAEAAGGAVGAGVQRLGGAVTEAAGVAFDVHRKREMFEAELQSIENEKQVLEAFEQAKQQAPEGADGFTDAVQEQFDNWVPQALNRAPATHEAQRHIQVRTEQMRSRILQNAAQFQAASRAALDTRRAGEALDGMTNYARANPAEMDATLQRFQEFAEMAPLPDDQTRAKFRDEGERQVLAGALDGWVTQYELTPMPIEQVDAAVKALKGGAFGFRDRVKPSVFDAALTRLENRKKSLDVESTALYGKDFADLIAAISVNGPEADSGLVHYQRALEVHKGDAKLAERDIQQIEEAKRLYTTKQSLISMPFAKAEALSERIRAGVQGAGAEYKARNYEEFERARRAVLAEYGRDKVAYTYRANPGIAAMMRKAEANGDEDGLREGMSMLKQFQTDMGTPAWAVEVMGSGAATQIAQSLNGLGAEQAADQLEQLQRRYGADWPLAMRELEDAKVAPSLLVLGRLNTKEDAGWRKQLAGWMQEGRQTLRTNVGNLPATDIDSKIDSRMLEFGKTIRYAGREGQAILRREREAMAIAAYGLYLQGGYTADAAAQEAFNRNLGNRYDFGETYRAPKGELGMVERATDIEVSIAKPEMFMPVSPGRMMDPRIAGSQRDEYLQRAAYENAVNQGFWVNNQMGDGLIRMAPDAAGTYAPVLLADGRQWEVKFAAIRKNPPSKLQGLGTPFPATGYRADE
jgi:hypothetical protein